MIDSNLHIDDLKFHHLGIACRDIDKEVVMLKSLGYEQEGPDFVDKSQGVAGRFMIGPGPRLELLEQLEGSETLKPWLAQGVKIYHQGFEVRNLEGEIDRFKNIGAKIMSPPVPAIAFDGRRICFLMLPTMMLIEIIEEF